MENQFADEVAKLSVYQRISEHLRIRISNGEWPVGTRIPSRLELAKQYGVNLITVQRAISSLLEEGVLQALERKGTFVAPGHHAIAAPANQDTFIPSTTSPGLLGVISAYGVLPSELIVEKDEWIPIIVHTIESAYSAAGGRTRFIDVQRAPASPHSWQQAMTTLAHEGANALVLIFFDQPIEGIIDSIIPIAQTLDLPIVCITWRETFTPMLQVFYDHWYGGYLAASHLLANGYRRLLYFAPSTSEWVTGRYAGALAAIEEAGLPHDAITSYPEERVPASMDLDYFEMGQQYATQAVHDGILPAYQTHEIGVIAANDQLAYGLMDVLREQGKMVGKDFGIVGFDDDPLSRSYDLTTVRPPLEEMAKTAVELLLHAQRGEPSAYKVCLRSRLIIRGSSQFLG